MIENKYWSARAETTTLSGHPQPLEQTTMKADHLLTALLSDMSINRSGAVYKILATSRAASSLEELRTAIEAITQQMERVDQLREESYRKAIMHAMKD